MRRRSAMRRRREAHGASPARRRATVWVRALGVALGRWVPPQRVRRVLPALALLLGIGLLFGVRPAAASAVQSGLPARIEGPPVVARWVDYTGDPKLGIGATAYTLWMGSDEKHVPGTFIFTITASNKNQVEQVQVSGTVSLGPPDGGTFLQQGCAAGQATFNTTPIEGGLTHLSSHTNLTVEPVVFQLRARVDQIGLVAYAQLRVVATNTADTTLCGTGTGTIVQMVSGCDPVSDTCSDAVNDPTIGIVHSVNTYANAVRADDWGQVYTLTSQLVTGQYSAVEFSALIQSEYGSAGRITDVSRINVPPDVRFDAGGQAYFKVSQTITFDKNGQTNTTAVTSYYLFEAGAWKFWFSCDPTAKC